ncbi:outer membrane lipoprotein-sorting protein, partial [Myxococcota bacterium]|nr:outer membrane lipoprotein-sorting protein [Myxococcota bacterium]
MRFEGSESIATLTIVNQRGQKRVRKIATVSKLFDDGKTEKRLIRFIAPADIKGTGLLTWDYEDKSDDMWLFMPALRKTRRIVASDKAKSFMGSEFSYSDITPPAIADFK